MYWEYIEKQNRKCVQKVVVKCFGWSSLMLAPWALVWEPVRRGADPPTTWDVRRVEPYTLQNKQLVDITQ